MTGGKWRCTHVLADREGEMGEVYLWRGRYYTREQWRAGERGLHASDLNEGETLTRAGEDGEDYE